MLYKNEHKTLLILDLDETLIYASNTKLEFRPTDFTVFHYYVYKRPYLSIFFEAIQNDFLFAVWSSASEDYVQAIVENIIPSNISLEFVWARNRCNYKPNFRLLEENAYYSDNFQSHYCYTKPLKKVRRKGYTLERILIVDDTPQKVVENYGNAIYASEYLGALDDEELMPLSHYLLTLKDHTQLRKIEKRNWKEKINSPSL